MPVIVTSQTAVCHSFDCCHLAQLRFTVRRVQVQVLRRVAQYRLEARWLPPWRRNICHHLDREDHSALGVMPHNTCVFISTAVRTQILRTSGYFVLTFPEFETRLFGDCSEGRTSPVVAHGTWHVTGVSQLRVIGTVQGALFEPLWQLVWPNGL